jgi:hypothetical protein
LEQDSRGNYTTLNPIYAKQFWMPDIFIGKMWSEQALVWE